jgi:peptidyl-prolyl cis-trans isomerase SDCCAG10
MSTSEPSTSAVARIRTSIGVIEVELWAKEVQKSCRRFIQAALYGRFDGLSFHRVVPGFLVQAGDDGNSEKLPVEKHSRLRFSRRGIVALAGIGDQFFVTLTAAPELTGKHSIIGRVSGDSLFNVLKIGEGEVEGEVPAQPVVIHRIDIIEHPFDDLRGIVREEKKPEKETAGKKVKKSKVKNLNLLSFDAGNEEVGDIVIQSSHDLLQGKDKKLSTRTVVEADQEQENQNQEQEQEKHFEDGANEEIEYDMKPEEITSEKDDELERRQSFDHDRPVKSKTDEKPKSMDYESLKQELLGMKQKRNRSDSESKSSKESILEQRRKKFLKNKSLDKFERQEIVSLFSSNRHFIMFFLHRPCKSYPSLKTHLNNPNNPKSHQNLLTIPKKSSPTGHPISSNSPNAHKTLAFQTN